MYNIYMPLQKSRKRVNLASPLCTIVQTIRTLSAALAAFAFRVTPANAS